MPIYSTLNSILGTVNQGNAQFDNIAGSSMCL